MHIVWCCTGIEWSLAVPLHEKLPWSTQQTCFLSIIKVSVLSHPFDGSRNGARRNSWNHQHRHLIKNLGFHMDDKAALLHINGFWSKIIPGCRKDSFEKRIETSQQRVKCRTALKNTLKTFYRDRTVHQRASRRLTKSGFKRVDKNVNFYFSFSKDSKDIWRSKKVYRSPFGVDF